MCNILQSRVDQSNIRLLLINLLIRRIMFETMNCVFWYFKFDRLLISCLNPKLALPHISKIALLNKMIASIVSSHRKKFILQSFTSISKQITRFEIYGYFWTFDVHNKANEILNNIMQWNKNCNNYIGIKGNHYLYASKI